MPDYYDNHRPSRVRPRPARHRKRKRNHLADNSSSGPAAYVIFAVGVAVLGLVLSAILGFFSVLVPYAISEIGNMTSSETSHRVVRRGTTTQNTEGLSEQKDSASQTLTPAAALDLNLAPYSSLIDDEVSAFDYSGADASVTQ